MKVLKGIVIMFVLSSAALLAQVNIGEWQQKANKIMQNVRWTTTHIVDDTERATFLAKLETQFQELNDTYGVTNALSFEDNGATSEEAQAAAELYETIKTMLSLQKEELVGVNR